MDDFGDIPVGLTSYDAWLNEVFRLMMVNKLIDITDYRGLDYCHWYGYYDVGYTPQEAFEEDLTAYGD